MKNKTILKKTEEARRCMEQAVQDEIVKKALLGQNVVVSRGGKPICLPAADVLKERGLDLGRASEEIAGFVQESRSRYGTESK